MCIPPSSLDPGYTRSPKRLNIQIILVVLPASADGFWIGKLWRHSGVCRDMKLLKYLIACMVIQNEMQGAFEFLANPYKSACFTERCAPRTEIPLHGRQALSTLPKQHDRERHLSTVAHAIHFVHLPRVHCPPRIPEFY
jgi:hypothetical protein